MNPKMKYVVLMVCLLMCTVMSEDSVAEIDSTEPYTYLQPFGSNQIGGLMYPLVVFLEFVFLSIMFLIITFGCLFCAKATGLVDLWLAYDMKQELKKQRGY